MFRLKKMRIKIKKKIKTKKCANRAVDSVCIQHTMYTYNFQYFEKKKLNEYDVYKSV